jgi:transcriptional regulator with XRE-family HTH domain
VKSKLETSNKDSVLGEILQQRRLELNMSQRDIAKKLGYRNINFISMIERGGSRLPFEKLPDNARVYKMENHFLLIMIKNLYPGVWNVYKFIREKCKDILSDSSDSPDEILDKMLGEQVKKYHIKLTPAE